MTTNSGQSRWRPRVLAELHNDPLYVKVLLRVDCVIVSFHLDEANDEGS